MGSPHSAFLEWLKQTNNESTIRIALDQFLESGLPSNLVPQTSAASTSSTSAQSAPRRHKVLVNSRRFETAGVFVHPEDPIFKYLEISREFSDHMRDTGKIFLVFAGVPAGHKV